MAIPAAPGGSAHCSVTPVFGGDSGGADAIASRSCRKMATQKVVAAEVDLQRDIAVVVEECKQAPKEPFWTRVKQHLHL